MSTPLVVFINPVSGGGMGQSLIDALTGKENCYIVKLPDDASNWQETISSEVLHDEHLKIAVAGGDGSVNWVTSMLLDFYGKEGEHRPPLSVIPLGTGNDMARMLGWGSTYTNIDLGKLNDRIEAIRNSETTKILDVWMLSCKRTDIEEEAKKKIVLNYFSLGVDANIAADFETCRKSYPGCFCCHCMSKALYAPVGFGSLCGQPKLKSLITGTYKEGEEDKEYSFNSGSKTLIFQNILNMYSGKDTWYDESTPRTIDDHKFEVSEAGGMWSLGFMQLGFKTANNIAQVSASSFQTSEPIKYEIDGEAIVVNGPAKFDMDYYASYPILFSSAHA